jgi:hypothetical protein
MSIARFLEAARIYPSKSNKNTLLIKLLFQINPFNIMSEIYCLQPENSSPDYFCVRFLFLFMGYANYLFLASEFPLSSWSFKVSLSS